DGDRPHRGVLVERGPRAGERLDHRGVHGVAGRRAVEDQPADGAAPFYQECWRGVQRRRGVDEAVLRGVCEFVSRGVHEPVPPSPEDPWQADLIIYTINNQIPWTGGSWLGVPPPGPAAKDGWAALATDGTITDAGVAQLRTRIGKPQL